MKDELVEARLETRHFVFTAYGRDEVSARHAMEDGWPMHLRQCGVQPGEMPEDFRGEIGFRRIRMDMAYRLNGSSGEFEEWVETPPPERRLDGGRMIEGSWETRHDVWTAYGESPSHVRDLLGEAWRAFCGRNPDADPSLFDPDGVSLRVIENRILYRDDTPVNWKNGWEYTDSGGIREWDDREWDETGPDPVP